MNLFHVEEAEFLEKDTVSRSHMMRRVSLCLIISFGIARRLRIHRRIKFMELSFDKRPVQGVRCEDPVIGAENIIKGVKNLRR
ncbi:hypothetical protein J4731_18795 [Providencia rettgeri]|nr:hypothetical protein [Providencia rettgeri]